jgi:hypothetical protein
MTEAFPWETSPRYLLRERDKSYGPAFQHRVRAMGITEVTRFRPVHSTTENFVSSVMNCTKLVAHALHGRCGLNCPDPPKKVL